jgi:hypothetical protein
MTGFAEKLAIDFLARADIGHLALFLWAVGASILVTLTMRDAAENRRRSEDFMHAFLQELARFNRRIEEESE